MPEQIELTFGLTRTQELENMLFRLVDAFDEQELYGIDEDAEDLFEEARAVLDRTDAADIE